MGRIEDTSERIRNPPFAGPARSNRSARRGSALQKERGAEQAFSDGCAAAERRFRLKLLKHQLLDRVIENSKSATDCSLAIFPRIPRESDARGKRFVIRPRQTSGDAFVSRNYQTQRENSIRWTARAAIRATVEIDLVGVLE